MGKMKKIIPKKLAYYPVLFSLLCLAACENVLVVNLERQNLLLTGTLTTLQDTSASIVGEIVDLNLDKPLNEHGHCWDTLNPPSIDKACTRFGSINQIDTFQSILSGLRPQTVYFIRAYIQEGDNVKYGQVIQFTTGGTQSPPLSLSTLRIFNISNQGAELVGKIRGRASILNYGYVWNTLPEPSLANNLGTDNKGKLELNGETEFLLQIASLNSNIRYYLRPFAILDNPEQEVIYGDQVDFLTAP